MQTSHWSKLFSLSCYWTTFSLSQAVSATTLSVRFSKEMEIKSPNERHAHYKHIECAFAKFIYNSNETTPASLLSFEVFKECKLNQGKHEERFLQF